MTNNLSHIQLDFQLTVLSIVLTYCAGFSAFLDIKTQPTQPENLLLVYFYTAKFFVIKKFKCRLTQKAQPKLKFANIQEANKNKKVAKCVAIPYSFAFQSKLNFIKFVFCGLSTIEQKKKIWKTQKQAKSYKVKIFFKQKSSKRRKALKRS